MGSKSTLPKQEGHVNGVELLRERKDASSLPWRCQQYYLGYHNRFLFKTFLFLFFLLKGIFFAFVAFFNEPRGFFSPYIVIDLFCNAILPNIHGLI